MDFVNFLKDDKSEEYIISLTKTSSIKGEIPDLTGASQIYVTYKNIEFKVDKFLKVEYVGSNNNSNQDSGSNSGNSGNVQLRECNRYIKVDVTKKF